MEQQDKWFYTFSRTQDVVDDEQEIRMTWPVMSTQIHIPLYHVSPFTPIPLTTINISGGHKDMFTEPFSRLIIKKQKTTETSITMVASNRPVFDLLEKDNTSTKDEKDGGCIIH
jgi:hypothetical protein